MWLMRSRSLTFRGKLHTMGKTERTPWFSIQRYRCACRYTNTYFLALPAERVLTSQQQQAHLVPRLWILYIFLQLKGLELLEEMTDSGAGARKFKMRLEYLTVSKSKKRLQKLMEHVKRTQEPNSFKEFLMAKSGTI